MDFSQALTEIKAGNRLSRAQWKNANYVYMVPGGSFVANKKPIMDFVPEGTTVTYRDHIDMCGSDGLFGTWQPSSVDLFASDWSIVPLQ